MKTLSRAVAALSFVAMSASAYAADMPLKAAPRLQPTSIWEGWYAGVNLGGGFGTFDGTYGVPATLPTFPASTPNNATSKSLSGVIGGGQIGYNWQRSNWVLGLEADFQGSSQEGSANSFGTGNPTNINLAIPATIAIADSERLQWFGTVRGRVGMLVTPTWLVYGTGGLAYGHINSAETISVSSFAGVTAVSGSAGTTRTGWTAGAGVEGKVSGNWTAKVEYLYMDLGSFSNTFTGIGNFSPITVSTHVTDNVARVGLNYRFH